MKAQKNGVCAPKQGNPTGKGTYGSVYKGKIDAKDAPGLAVALKEYVLPSQKDDEETRSMVEEAVSFLLDDMQETLLKIEPHPNLCRYYGVEYLPGVTNDALDRVMLTVDWVEQNKKLKGPLPEEEVKVIAKGILKGLAHLHKAGITHDDIRPCNILSTTTWARRESGEAADSQHAVLCDFGIFKKIQDILDPAGGGATTKQKPAYVAPEVFTDGKDYDGYKADIWAIGASLLELLSGKLPWFELDPSGKGNIMFKVIQSRTPPKYPDSISPLCKSFLDCLFNRDFSSRPSAAAALTHEWLK